MLGAAYVAELRQLGRRSGLDAVGVAPANPFIGTRRHLEERRRAGLHGGMSFTYRNPSRSTDPDRALPGVAALVVAARAYDHDALARPSRPAAGRVAAYARADHYGDLRAGLGRIAERLQADGWRCRVVVDDNALVDREAAYRAGLGWYGKNANLLLPEIGSWVVLGTVLTTAPLPADPAPVDDGCGPCRRCLDACPTRAIVAPGVVDARRCLAWLVQAEGDFPVQFREALGDRLYGCDECQTACPINRLVDRTSRLPVAGQDGDVARPRQPFVDVVELLAATDEALLARHGRWYIPRRDPRYLRRNALVVLGNIGAPEDPAVIETLRRYCRHADPLLREHARWAAERLGVAGVVEPAAVSST